MKGGLGNALPPGLLPDPFEPFLEWPQSADGCFNNRRVGGRLGLRFHLRGKQKNSGEKKGKYLHGRGVTGKQGSGKLSPVVP